jgi:hypothetical protein
MLVQRQRIAWVSVFAGFLAACNCGPGSAALDGGDDAGGDAGMRRRDGGGFVVLPSDGGPKLPPLNASEPCPPEAFGRVDDGDGGFVDAPDGSVFGLCAVTRRLRGQALLNERPVSGPVRLQFIAGGFRSDFEKIPDALGQLDVRVLRNGYDQFKYEPSPVFLTHRGFIDYGPLDLTQDQDRRLATKSHTLSGSVLFGGVPFRSQRLPPDVRIDAFSPSLTQEAEVTSSAGSYQLKLLEGQFVAYLSTPYTALFGTRLQRYQLNNINLDFTRDSVLDVDVPARLVEGRVLLDGRPVADRLAGAPDWRLDYVRAAESTTSVYSYHEGGVDTYSALVPAGRYQVLFGLEQADDRRYPSELRNFVVSPSLDLTRTGSTMDYELPCVNVEGALSIDGRPPRLFPSAKWQLFMNGRATSSSPANSLLYELPLDGPSFQLRTPPNVYSVAIALNQVIADDLASGFFLLDRFRDITRNTTLPIDIETGTLSGRLLVDGQPPRDGERAGRFIFVSTGDGNNRFAVFFFDVRPEREGLFQMRLPKGSYRGYFEIDRKQYPEYAAGWQNIVANVDIDGPTDLDIAYETIVMTGPIRVDGLEVPDRLAGDDVGLVMRRDDSFEFTWGFAGGSPNYRLRAPKGRYYLDFVINRGGLDESTAWGKAPMGLNMPIGVVADDMQTGR